MIGTTDSPVTAKSPAENNCGGTNADNGATGATCAAVVKVVNSTDYSLLIDASTDTTHASTDGETVNVDFELTEAHVGHFAS